MKTSARSFVVAVGTLIAAAGAAHAQHHVEYGLNLSLGPTQYIEDYRQGAAPSGAIVREVAIPGYGHVAGVANVGFGVNKARVELSGTNPDNPLYFEYGFATSQYFDVIQIDDPELNGTHGFFDVTLFVAGSGDTTISDGYRTSPDTEFYAFWHAVINVWVEGVTDEIGNPIQSVYYAGEWYKAFESDVMGYWGDPLNTYQRTRTIEFIYGEPMVMDCFLQVDTQFDNQRGPAAGTLSSVIDLGNSSYWGGVRNLRDAQGRPVTNAAFSSSSGFNYRTSALPGQPTCRADVCGVGGPPILPDGQLTVDDIIAFVNAFSDATGCPGAAPCNLADVTDVGGAGAADGQLTVDDIIGFVNTFGDGC